MRSPSALARPPGGFGIVPVAAVKRDHVHTVAVRPGEDVHDDVGIYNGLGVRALGRALHPLVAQAPRFLGESFHTLRGAKATVGADVETLEGNVSVGAVSERPVRKFSQVHAPLEAIGCLQEIPTIHQYCDSLYVFFS